MSAAYDLGTWKNLGRRQRERGIVLHEVWSDCPQDRAGRERGGARRNGCCERLRPQRQGSPTDREHITLKFGIAHIKRKTLVAPRSGRGLADGPESTPFADSDRLSLRADFPPETPDSRFDA